MQTRIAKNGNKYKVYAKVGGNEFTIGSFPINKKREAIKFEKDALTKSIGELGIKMEPVKTDRITFDDAFKQYYKAIDIDAGLNPKTKDGYTSILRHHIQPYINKNYLDEYKAVDFKIHTKNSLLKSFKVQNGERTRELIGSKTIKRAVEYFKRFLIFCKDNEWNIEIEEILAFKFSKRSLENRDIPEDLWLPKANDVYNMINSQKSPDKKAWIHFLAETGTELSAALGVCYDDVFYDDELASNIIYIRHSLDGDSQFRPDYLKTSKRRRKIQISPELYQLLRAWMDIQINPKTFARKYRRVFPYRKEYGASIVKAAAKKAGVKWKKGASPFRKYSASVIYASKAMDDASFAMRYGWSKELKTFKGFYQKPISDLNKNKRTAAINNLITNGGTNDS